MKKMLFPAAAALLIAAVLLSLCLGASGLALSELPEAVRSGISTLPGRIFYLVRLPRTAGCVLAGAALAVAGCVIQAVLSNSLASPNIIGVNAGAGLAVTVLCACGAISGWVIAAGSFLGALAAVMLVSLAAQKAGLSRTTVILGGVAVNSFLNALSEAIVNLVPDAGLLSSDFRVGGFSSVSYPRLIPAGILILAALAVVLTLCHELDVMALGEETAQGLGLPVSKMRTVFLVLAALLAGASVSFAGLLGFVGLLVPHAVRRIAGSESRVLLPLSALLGAAFVMASDLAARLIFAPYELPVGILMSLLGGPCFLWMLLRRKGGHRDD